jgi:hypothetical protein
MQLVKPGDELHVTGEGKEKFSWLWRVCRKACSVLVVGWLQHIVRIVDGRQLVNPGSELPVSFL